MDKPDNLFFSTEYNDWYVCEYACIQIITGSNNIIKQQRCKLSALLIHNTFFIKEAEHANDTH